MPINIDSIKANIARENDGDWVDIPDWPGVRLKVRGTNYPPYQLAKAIVEQRWGRRYAREPVPPEMLYKENARLYADHILLDWEDFAEDGRELVYSPALAKALLTDPAFRQLHDQIRYAMQQVSETEVTFLEDTARNLSPSSSGN